MAQDIGAATTVQARTDARRGEWFRNGVVSGFTATLGMTVVIAIAYGLTNLLGDVDGGQIARWFAALGDNPVTRRTADGMAVAIGLNLLIGWVFALVYARWAEPALDGPGWRKGMVFALVLWLLSLVLFLPLVGGGLFGVGLGAGPLPIFGNLVLHLVYGGILGAVYGLMAEDSLDSSEAEWAGAVGTGRGAAIGVAGGVLVGLLLGWLLAPQIVPDGGGGTIVLAGALIGGAFGFAAGSFAGMAR
ncbi:MAG: hypothetical protein H0U10_00235 [Chloroflexia bacterium]|nr:hypothetical protein [Chloroflexia bacterium]